MHRKIRCDRKSKFFCKFFWKVNKAITIHAYIWPANITYEKDLNPKRKGRLIQNLNYPLSHFTPQNALFL